MRCGSGRRWAGRLVAVGVIFVSLVLSWHALAKLDFLYPVWYSALGIEDHVSHYAARNRQGKQNFVLTEPAEHHRLFGAVVDGIHGRGTPLDQLVYRDRDGNVLGTFLRADEVGHLRDVAALVDKMLIAGWSITAATVILVLLHGRSGACLPTLVRAMLGYGILLGLAGVVVGLVGPQAVFDGLHEWIFASGHPWFFYYEDSLMTTVMKAPDIFAAVAATWLVLHLIVYALLLAGLRLLANVHKFKRPEEQS
nr:DUF1461 domain-containing protein [Thioalkalivibrio sp.]